MRLLKISYLFFSSLFLKGVLLNTLLVSAILISGTVSAKNIEHEMGHIELTKTPKKIVSLDWVITESLLTLGITPYAVADAQGYQKWVKQPELKDTVFDVGSRREPNLELLAQIKPDLIIISAQLSTSYEKLSRIAPTLVLSVYSNKKTPYQSAEKVLTALAYVADKQALAQQVISATRKDLIDNGKKLAQAGLANRPLLLLRLIGDKHVRVHGMGSLANATITNMGLSNSWQNKSNDWGFSSVGLAEIAPHQHASLIYFGPVDKKEKQQVLSSPLWQAMAFSRQNRVYELPPVWTFGGLNSARILSDHITRLLLDSVKDEALLTSVKGDE